MTKQKSTKRALLLSALSLLMCVSMLIGSTFAWFTDSVTSGKNVIAAGNLDVELYYTYDAAVAANADSDAWVKVEATTDVFGYNRWEPGYTKVAYFKVVNEGTLALNYRLSADVYEEDKGVNKDGKDFLLSDYIKTALVPVDATREQILAQTGNSLTGKFVMADTLTDPAHTNELEAGKSAVVGMAIWMPTSVGNVANHDGETVPSITFGINLVATQKTFEKDSFDDQYDADAKYPLGKPEFVSDTADDIKAVVDIPAEAPEGDYELELSAIIFENEAGKTTMSFDMSLIHNDVKVTDSGLPYLVTVELPHHFMEITDIKHNGESVGTFDYDPDALTVSFTTNGFSPFVIEYTDYTDPSFPLEYEVIDLASNEYKITKGMFVGKNPADYDDSLKDPNSEYIAVDYVKDGLKHYAVSERATTLVIAADDAKALIDQKAEGYYNGVLQKNVNADLWKAFIQDDRSFKRGASTVYILPGTYECGTTLSVSISCDIIGLGNKEDIKILKGDSQGSNQHLFNCSTSADEYIQVVIRNMTLEAVKKNINKNQTRDNAAVQAIRRSKVKCYDLVIIKGAYGGSDNDAFYVNANNLECDTYLYAENCILKNDTKATYSAGDIVSIHQSAQYTQHFYYYNLTCEGSEQTVFNPTPTLFMGKRDIRNVQLPADNWTWEIN